MSREPRVSIRVLPPMTVVDGMIVVYCIIRRSGERLIRAGDLQIRVSMTTRSVKIKKGTYTKPLQKYSEITPTSQGGYLTRKGFLLLLPCFIIPHEIHISRHSSIERISIEGPVVLLRIPQRLPRYSRMRYIESTLLDQIREGGRAGGSPP